MEIERIQLEVVGSYDLHGKIDIEQLNTNLQKISGLNYNGKDLSYNNKISTLPAILEKEDYTIKIEIDGTVNELKKIPETESYIGYYADVDNDGTPDGVIYADLSISKSGKWTNDNGIYSYDSKNGLKKYFLSNEKYTKGKFGEKEIITTYGEGNERFYVMALEDLETNTSNFYWYKNAYGNMTDYATATSVNFGTGKENTLAMISKWEKGAVDNGGYGIQDNRDLWYAVKSQIEDKNSKWYEWFVPSKGELSAFAHYLGTKESDPLTINNYNTIYGLSDWFWSSSQGSSSYAWYAAFGRGYINIDWGTYRTHHVRLSTIF